MESIAAFLIQMDLFAGLDEATIQQIASQFKVIQFQEEETVFAEKDEGDAFYIVIDGVLSILQETGRGLRELKKIGRHEIFGEMALISQERRSATVRTATDARCLRMSRLNFNDLIETEPKFSQRMLTFLTNRLRHSDELANKEILNAHQALIFSLSNLVESRDKLTGDHLHRVREYCSLLASNLARHPKFQTIITPVFIENIYIVSPLHDIGKVAIPDGILLKPGKLTRDEFEIIKQHSIIGGESIARVLEFCDNETFRMAFNIVRHHHERYDGHGYPDGLKGEAIPVEARIVSIADYYDAILSKRSYKQPFTYKQAEDEIRSQSGVIFDPVIAEAMLSSLDEFESIHQKYT